MNNTYIRHDIWPVSPFDDPDLYDWFHALPIHHKINKNILRAYHEAYGFTREIYAATENEDFTESFVTCFNAGVYDDAVLELVDHAVTIDAGYVDQRELMSHYQNAKGQSIERVAKEGHQLFMWMLTEINAQHSGI